MLVSAMLPLAAAAAAAVGFRPPAIPLFTADPYMQTWVMADNTTSDTVRHWDQTEKSIVGMVR